MTGAAVLSSGETVLILNPVPLAQRAALETAQSVALVVTPLQNPVTIGASAGDTGTNQRAVAQAAPGRQATVLVVDDSLTVRKMTQRLLARRIPGDAGEGWR